MIKDQNKCKSTIMNNREYSYKERREAERRTKKSNGYAYISIVGWIDRREKFRRESDTNMVSYFFR